MALTKSEMGMLIKEARKLKSKSLGKNYTQNDLAKDIGISRSYLGDIEGGRTYPNYILLNKIADACEVPFSFFDKNATKSKPENTLKLIEKDTDNKRSFAGKLIDMLIEQDFFDDPDNIPQDTVNTIMKALKKDIQRAIKNKEVKKNKGENI